MLKPIRQFSAIMLWWVCYIPLNAFILSVFLKQVLTAGKNSMGQTKAEPDDSEMIKNWADSNLSDKTKIKDDEGFGTRFERHMMSKLLLDLAKEYGLKSVLESPADGVTGIPGANSLPLAGIVEKPVALTNPSEMLLESAIATWSARELRDKVQTFPAAVARLPFESGAYDLVWSFCMLERLKDASSYLDEAARVSGKTVLMVTLNYSNHGTWLHRVYHRVLGLGWDHGRFGMMTLSGIKRSFQRSNLEIVAWGAVDVPPTWDTWDMPLGADISRVMALFGKKWEWKASSPGAEKGFLLSLFEWMEDNLPVWFKLQNPHLLFVGGRQSRNEK